jgi:tRNA (guanine-N7-)-methyltransferase
MPRVRIHQHVNPLAPYFRFTPDPIELEKVFANPAMPLFLDLGCGRGRFLLKMAEIDRTQNFLGVEIREPLVIEANQIAERKGLPNLHYEFCNAMLALDKLLEKLPPNILQTVAIQFPDPWFKKRHAKRRMVKPSLVKTVVHHLSPEGQIFVQTDVEDLAEEIFDLFRQQEELEELEITENPFPVKTEREISVENRNLPVLRKLFKMKIQDEKTKT